MTQTLNILVERWETLTFTVLDKKGIPKSELLGVIKESYRILRELCKESLVPKEVTKLFLEMESFLYFAFLMEEKEVEHDFYEFAAVHRMVEGLKDGFFTGEYPAAFPKIPIVVDEKKVVLFDLDTDCLEKLKR